ncbi:hypothetical protein EGM51_03840 [Verrucomicrobia bacterium S94]|nr:hypothetical protein EGM51_03840 [Verrucomicrobia bacterium S94]
MRITVLTIVALCLFLGRSTVSAIAVVSDDFSSYISGVPISGHSWDPKNDSGGQQELFTGRNGEYAVLDGGVEQNYHIPNQTGFTIGAGEYAVVSSDFRYVYAGGEASRIISIKMCSA